MKILDAAPADFAADAEIADFVADAVSAQGAVFAPRDWSPLTRLGFRIGFIYFICFMYLYGNDGIDFQAIVIWHGLSNFLDWPLNHLGIWASRHIFHLKHISPYWSVTHRGDTLMNWVLDQVFIAIAIIGGLVWTVIAALRGSRRTEYWTELAWIRFLLRLSVAFFMIGYGFIKVFPLQMGPIPIPVLNETLGQATGHTLLWSMVALHPWYEVICGVSEVIGGTLVLFRRTALAGTLICIFIMSNVLLYNFFFDVSVKLFALNLLLAEIFIVLPDVPPLFAFFWRHEPAIPTGGWVPLDQSWQTRFFVRTLEISFLVVSFTIVPAFNGIMWHHERVMARVSSPLLGAWRRDAAQVATGPFIMPDHQGVVLPSGGGAAVEFYVDTVDHAYTRAASGALWRYYVSIDPAAHTLFINPFVAKTVTYRWQMPDANHLILTPLPQAGQGPGASQAEPNALPASAPRTISFTRMPLPTHYRLFEPRFNFVMFGMQEQ
jgi:hypothetical protein